MVSVSLRKVRNLVSPMKIRKWQKISEMSLKVLHSYEEFQMFNHRNMSQNCGDIFSSYVALASHTVFTDELILCLLVFNNVNLYSSQVLQGKISLVLRSACPKRPKGNTYKLQLSNRD